MEGLGASRKLIGGSLGAYGNLLGAFGGPLGASCGHLATNHGLPERPGHDLECFGRRLGAIWGCQWGSLGAILGPCWTILGLFWTVWKPFEAVVGGFGGPLRQTRTHGRPKNRLSNKSTKNIKKRVVFCAWRASWESSLGRLRASWGCLGPRGALAGPFGRPPDRFGPAGKAQQGRPGGPKGSGIPLQGRPGGPKSPRSRGSGFPGGGRGGFSHPLFPPPRIVKI